MGLLVRYFCNVKVRDGAHTNTRSAFAFVFMAQDIGEITGDRYQPSRLSRCGEARHHRRHELASHPQRRAWKQAHLAMLVKLGKRAWLHCDDCRHSIMIEPHELAQRHQLDMRTPLLTISKAMRCARCGARRECCWPEPHNTRGRVRKAEGQAHSSERLTPINRPIIHAAFQLGTSAPQHQSTDPSPYRPWPQSQVATLARRGIILCPAHPHVGVGH